MGEARRWLASNPEDLQTAERAFLEASVVAEDERLLQERTAMEEKIRLMRERLRLAQNRAVFATAAAVLAAIAIALTALAIQSDQARQTEEKGHRTTRLAKTRLLQDASLDRERMGDIGTGAVLLGHALVEAEAVKQNQKLEDALRVAVTMARSQLFPLRNILEVTGDSRGCAVRPDGKLAVVGTSKGQVWYVDLVGSRLTTTPASAGKLYYQTGTDPQLDSVSAVAFNPNRAHFVAATNQGTIHFVDTFAGGTVRKMSHAGQPMSVNFSPEGKSLVVAGFRDENRHAKPVVMAIYDVESGVCTRTFPLSYELYAAAFSPDGRWVAAGGGDPARSPARGVGLECAGSTATHPRAVSPSVRA